MKQTAGSPADRERAGSWLQTYTGKVFWPLDPRAEDVDINDIAQALANQCRYGGHVKQFYSVAEHSVHVSKAVPHAHALWGLLHDASEAYLVDVPRPIKIHMPEYRAWEARLMAVICARFGLFGVMPASVKVADNRMLATEQAAIMNPCARSWENTGPKIDTIAVACWPPNVARAMFLRRFHDLAN